MYNCPQCKTTWITKNSYLKHFDGHIIGSKKLYPCPICAIRFKNRKSFYEHMDSHDNIPKLEPKKEKELYCRHCDKVFLSKKAIEDHFQTFGENDMVFCPFCNSKSLPSFAAYKMHKNR